NPELMPGLLRNIAPFPSQRAFCTLLGDCRREVDFHIASNCGASSSLFALGSSAVGRESLWPDIDLHIERTVRLPMETVDAFLAKHKIDLASFDTWVLDVQGAEVLVLVGATHSLRSCRVIRTEVSTVEVYEGGARYADLRAHFAAYGFVPLLEPHVTNVQ